MLRILTTLLALIIGFIAFVSVPAASAQAPCSAEVEAAAAPRLQAMAVNQDDGAATNDAGTDEAAGENRSSLAAADVAAPAPSCADSPGYPGPFENEPVGPTARYAVPSNIMYVPTPVPSAASVAAATPAASTALAHSGSETAVLAYLGTGLLAFGACAMGMRRYSHAE